MEWQTSKNTRKILLALLVVFTLLMSMATVTAFADDSATADDGTTIYFENNWLWTDVCCYYWGDGIAAPEWPGIPMDNVGMANGHEVYSFNVPTGVTGIIINGLKDDNSGNRDQTPDIFDGIVDGAGWKMEWADGNLVIPFDYDPSNPDQGGSTGGSTDEGAVYTVAGVAGLCYSNWDPSDTYNDMTLNPETGLYEKTFTGIPAGTYECKVVANHAWGQEWGGTSGEYGNYGFDTFDEHDITITFDPATGTVGHTLADSTGAAEDRPTAPAVDFENCGKKTIYFGDNMAWNTVYVHVWIENGNNDIAYRDWTDGLEMTWDSEKCVYYVEIPNVCDSVVFHSEKNGGEQTGDLVIPYDGALYDSITTVWMNIKDYAPPVPPEDTTEEVTVYVKDDAGWGQVYIHFWSTTGIEATTFPGVAMEKDENGYWVFTIPAENYGVLFTNGINWDQPGAAQTPDLLIPTDGKVYISNANECLYNENDNDNNSAWYSVGGNTGDSGNNGGNTGDSGNNDGNTGDNGNVGDNTPDVPSDDQPAKEMSFLQKLALKLLLFLRSIEDMFKGFFKK